jgi:hypothetical protein
MGLIVTRGKAELIRDGKVVEQREFGNIVPNIGFQLICLAVGSYSTKTGTPSARYIAIGSSATAPGAAQTALGGELARGIGSYTFPSGSKYYRLQKLFPAGTGTGSVQESGQFNKSTGGAMLNRGTFAVIISLTSEVVAQNKGASDTLREVSYLASLQDNDLESGVFMIAPLVLVVCLALVKTRHLLVNS